MRCYFLSSLTSLDCSIVGSVTQLPSSDTATVQPNTISFKGTPASRSARTTQFHEMESTYAGDGWKETARGIDERQKSEQRGRKSKEESQKEK